MKTDHDPEILNVFQLQEEIARDYEDFSRSFTPVRAADLERQVKQVCAEKQYWPDPLLQLNPLYQKSVFSFQHWAEQGRIEPELLKIFSADGRPLDLYRHQERALECASRHQSFVVTTGTGSGKSLCFFMPIVDRILKEKKKDASPRTRAIIIYPMNALANSQQGEIEKYLKNAAGCISVGRYTGQEDEAARSQMAQNPPDILLTNFMMLELLLVRYGEHDRNVIGHCAGLQFLVLDELHSYRGRQGADVAMLIRRLRLATHADDLLCIGTSATMSRKEEAVSARTEGPQSDAEPETAKAAVRQIAKAFFGLREEEDLEVIGESLERKTDPALDGTRPEVKRALAAELKAWDGGAPQWSDQDFFKSALAIWTETSLGLQKDPQNPASSWLRAKPIPLEEAFSKLKADAALPDDHLKSAYRKFLFESGKTEQQRGTGRGGKPFFTFRLHQFFSGMGLAYATLEKPPLRKLVCKPMPQMTVKDEQGSHEARLYPVLFCRHCGQEYYAVRQLRDKHQRKLLPRPVDLKLSAEEIDSTDDCDAGQKEIDGYAVLQSSSACPIDFTGKDTDFPESWLELGGSLKKGKSKFNNIEALNVLPDGTIAGPAEGQPIWFIRGPFRFCLQCKEEALQQTRERNKLSQLSSEGRSSATTIIADTVLARLNEGNIGQPHTRKLLGFVDNRQDAAFQTDYFNDFEFLSILRAGLLCALEKASPAGIEGHFLGQKLFDALELKAHPQIWFSDEAVGRAFEKNCEWLRQYLHYLLWHDQQGSRRINQPDLEQLGLVSVDYLDLEIHCGREDLFCENDFLSSLGPKARALILKAILDLLRHRFALYMNFNPGDLPKSGNSILPPWQIDQLDEIEPFNFALSPLEQAQRDAGPGAYRKRSAKAAWRTVKLGQQSALGRLLRSDHLKPLNLEKSEADFGFDLRSRIEGLSKEAYNEMIDCLLRQAEKVGLLKRYSDSGLSGYQLNTERAVFLKATPENCPNKYYRQYYEKLAKKLNRPGRNLDFSAMMPEARTHTAQIDAELRELREMRFRYTEEDQKALLQNASRLKERYEPNRFLPILYCSPTMELGIDIAQLNVVYMRNMPPSPANYAQRAGRSGRSGQSALALTFCSAQSPHDQYYFARPGDMVHGEVRPPMIDLTNRDLIESHLHAIWLTCAQIELPSSVFELFDFESEGAPGDGLPQKIKQAYAEALQFSPQKKQQTVRQMAAFLEKTGISPGDLGGDWAERPLDEFAAEIFEGSYAAFLKALDRWQTLYESALDQHRRNSAIVQQGGRYTKTQIDQANRMLGDAAQQLSLLRAERLTQNNDFYLYRYLATEGFLPGYNFPRLPLLAFLPGRQKGQGVFLQRPRFLALAEFGPFSLIYHEGHIYRVHAAKLKSEDRKGEEGFWDLNLTPLRICSHCGMMIKEATDECCSNCRQPLSDAAEIHNAFKIDNLLTRPESRITANDEERRRQGFEIQTCFRFLERDHQPCKETAKVWLGGTCIAHLSYGPGAEIVRLNKGLRRRAPGRPDGFYIDPGSGKWLSEKSDPLAEEGLDAFDDVRKQLVIPMVQDRKNALILQFGETLQKETWATLQQALLCGIETLFQVEESELLAEALPSRRDRNAILFYEATEGGAGVLNRLVRDPSALPKVAREALKRMHYQNVEAAKTPEALVDQKNECSRSCYHCLLSYYNQPEHELLNRRNDAALKMLTALQAAQVEPDPRQSAQQPGPGSSGGDERRLPPADGPIDLGEGYSGQKWSSKRAIAVDSPLPEERLRYWEKQKRYRVFVLDSEAGRAALRKYLLGE